MVPSFISSHVYEVYIEGFHPSRGVAASGFRPLRKISLLPPVGVWPVFSAIVAGCPLRPATDRSLVGRYLTN